LVLVKTKKGAIKFEGPVVFTRWFTDAKRDSDEMLTVRVLNATLKPSTGTTGSGAVERGFDLTIKTRPNFRTYRVVVVWTPNGLRGAVAA
jgi:hypothetical protein